MTGHHVLHAFGYDAFGLPAEQYAIDTGQHPRLTTQNNIDNMRRQLRRLGLGHDTRREVATTDLAFYRWTQWIFLKIFNSWCDERTGRARPIEELISEFTSGQRPAPDGRPWGELTAVEQRRAIDAQRLACISEEPVNWCPVWAPCWPTKKSPLMGAATSAITRSTAGRCGNGCFGSPRSLSG